MSFYEMLLAKKLDDDRDPKIEGITITENGTYSETGKAYSPVNVNVPLPSNAYLLKEVDGLPKDIATFSDGANLPMPSLKVGIEPVQDLHGYDAPWVGGGGKNKLPLDIDYIKQRNTGGTWVNNVFTSNTGVTFTVLINSVGEVVGVKVNGTATERTQFIVSNGTMAAGNYIFNGCPFGGSGSTYEMFFQAGSYFVDVGSGVSVTLSADTAYGAIIDILNGTTIDNTFYPMLRLSTETDATFAPYSNICPISGWTEANVTVCGVNVWNEEWRIDQNQFKAQNLIPVMPNTTYYFKCPVDVASAFKYDKNKNALGILTIGKNTIFTTGSDVYFIWFALPTDTYGTTYNNDISINYPSTDTEYHAFNGHTTTIPFLDSQGNPVTVYGGECDVVNGTVKPNIEYDSYNGETLVGRWISDRDVYAEGTTPTIGAQVVDLGAYGSDISVQPTSIKSIEGVNNVWGDTGDIEELSYFSKSAN